MSSKRFDLDIGKERARARLREFVRKRIFPRKDMRVLCLPGEVGYEIQQVWRKLGVPDENIVAVERDPSAARALRMTFPKLNIFEGELWDFCRRYEGPAFHVVSLDYCGYFAEDKTSPLLLLHIKEKLAERAVIMMNVLAGRETDQDQDTLRLVYAKILLDLRGMRGQTITSAEGMGSMNQILADAGAEELKQVRDMAMTYTLVDHTQYLAPAILTAVAVQPNPRGRMFGVTLDSRVEPSEDGRWTVSNTTSEDDLRFQLPVAAKHSAIAEINEAVAKAGIITARDPEWMHYHFGRSLVMAFYDFHGKARLPVSMERYSYVSDSGKRMLTDLIEVKCFCDELKHLDDAIGLEHDADGFTTWVLRPTPSEFPNAKAYRKYLENIIGEYARRVARHVLSEVSSFPARVDLGGGGSRPFDEAEVKKRIIEKLRKGYSNDEILMRVRGATMGTILALKAHLTMGSYDD